MANFDLAPKRVIINSPDQHALQYFNIKANGAWEKVANAANNPTAKILRISGFGDLFASTVTKARGAKGIAGVPEISTLTFGAGFLTTIGAGNQFTLRLDFTSSTLDSENANWDGRFGRPRYLTGLVKAGDTVTTLATRIKEMIEEDQNLMEVYLQSVSSAAGVLTLTTRGGNIKVKAYVEEDRVNAVQAITQAAFEGRGSFEQLKTVRIETPVTNEPYTIDGVQLPIKGQLYSNYQVDFTVTRPDLSGASVANEGPVKGIYSLELFINQTSCAAYIAELTKWLNANVANRTMYTATTAGATVNETPTVATAVDITPFTTGLV